MPAFSSWKQDLLLERQRCAFGSGGLRDQVGTQPERHAVLAVLFAVWVEGRSAEEAARPFLELAPPLAAFRACARLG